MLTKQTLHRIAAAVNRRVAAGTILSGDKVLLCELIKADADQAELGECSITDTGSFVWSVFTDLFLVQYESGRVALVTRPPVAELHEYQLIDGLEV